MTRRLLVLLGIASAILPAAWAASEPPALLRMLPPETVFFLRARDLPALRAALEHTPLARTWAEPQVQAFLEPVTRKMREALDEKFGALQAETGLSPAQVLDLFPGEAVFAVPDIGPLLEGSGENAPHLFVAAQLGSKTAEFEKLLRAARAKNGVVERDEEFQGKTIHVTLEPDAADGTPVEADAWAIVDDVYITGEPKAAVQAAIARLASGGTSVVDAPAWAAAREMEGKAALTALLNLEALVPAIIGAFKASGSNEPPPNSRMAAFGLTAESIIRGLGLDALRALAIGVSIDREATEISTAFTWAQRRGLLRMLAYGDPPAPRPAFVPDSWTSVSCMRFDLGQAVRALRETIREMSPALDGMVQMQIGQMNQQLGIDLERDLFGSLGDELVNAYTVPEVPGAPVDFQQPMDQLLAVTLSNAEAFARALDAVLAAFPPVAQMTTSRDYLGETIRRMGPPEQSGPVKGVHIAVTRDRLLVCVGTPAMIESAIQGRQGAAKPLWAKAEAREALATVPPGSVAIEYHDLRKLAVFIVEAIGQLAQQAAAESGGDDEPSPAPEAPSKPSREAVEKHWSWAVGSLRVEDGGVRSVVRIDHGD
jgi:hypothetical protein